MFTAVFQITASPSARSRQLWSRTVKFGKTYLQFYVYGLRFNTAGLTTLLIEFWTLFTVLLGALKLASSDDSKVQNHVNKSSCWKNKTNGKRSLLDIVSSMCYLCGSPCRLTILLLGNIDVSTLPDLTNEDSHHDTKNYKLKFLQICKHHISSWKLILEFIY